MGKIPPQNLIQPCQGPLHVLFDTPTAA